MFNSREIKIRSFLLSVAARLLIKAVVCVRSEPTTLGLLPHGAENQCGGQGAFFLSFNSSTLIYLHPPSIVTTQQSVRRTTRGELIRLSECACLGVWKWIYVYICSLSVNRTVCDIYVDNLLLFSLLQSLYFSSNTAPAGSLPVTSHWYHSYASAQLEVRKQYVNIWTMFPLKPLSWSILHVHPMFTPLLPSAAFLYLSLQSKWE